MPTNLYSPKAGTTSDAVLRALVTAAHAGPVTVEQVTKQYLAEQGRDAQGPVTTVDDDGTERFLSKGDVNRVHSWLCDFARTQRNGRAIALDGRALAIVKEGRAPTLWSVEVGQ